MPLTTSQVLLFDLLSDKVITIMGTMKKVPGMTEEEVDAETAKWEALSDVETDEIKERQKQ